MLRPSRPRRERPRLTCSLGFWLMAAALIYLDGQRLVLWGALACACHEAGHCAAAVALGGGVRALRLTAVGAELELDPCRPLSYGRELLTALAGPCVNLLLAWSAARTGRFLFAGMNLCFGALNLLPIRPLDGGRALACALCARSPQTADRVVNTLSAVCSGILLGFGVIAWREWGNVTLLASAVWLLAGAFR